jgi:hypothetical protein
MCFDIACFSWNCGKLEDAYQRLNMHLLNLWKMHSPSLKALFSDKLIKHSDVDVKVALASSVCSLQ